MSDDEVAATLNLRGVVCPMNFVKMKLKLEGMRSNDVLEVIVDDGESMQNVPRSVKDEDLPKVSQIVCAGYRWLAKRERYSNHELDRLIAERGSEVAMRQQCQRYRFLVACFGPDVVGVVGIEKSEITKLFVDPRIPPTGHGHQTI